MTVRVHPFPSRTRQLSSLVLTILGWKRPGTISRCQHKERDHYATHSGLSLCEWPILRMGKNDAQHRSSRIQRAGGIISRIHRILFLHGKTISLYIFHIIFIACCKKILTYASNLGIIQLKGEERRARKAAGNGGSPREKHKPSQ